MGRMPADDVVGVMMTAARPPRNGITKYGEKAMKKVLAALFVTAVAALVSMGFASTAQAGDYPCEEGTVANTPSATTTGTESDTPVVGCHSVTPPGDDTPPETTPPR